MSKPAMSETIPASNPWDDFFSAHGIDLPDRAQPAAPRLSQTTTSLRAKPKPIHLERDETMDVQHPD